MSAIISPCGNYRYRLERGEDPKLAFVMLNPSTADETRDDPTIRRCIAFAAREHYHGIVVCNVYAWRATDPDELRDAHDPFGENERYIEALSRQHRKIVVAWGSRAKPAHALDTCAALECRGADLFCFGVTKTGQPKHPLYVAAATPLQPYDALNPWKAAA